MNWGGPIYVRLKELQEAQKVFNALEANTDWKIRVEGRYLQVYSEHKDWLHRLSQKISTNEWHEPESILQPNTVTMGESMKGWEYRVTLGRNIPHSFCKWARTNESKLKYGTKFKKSIEKNSAFLTGLYFYVHNEKMLNLATLVLGPAISRIDKIIIEDKNE